MPPRLPVGERRALADAARAICAHLAAAFGAARPVRRGRRLGRRAGVGGGGQPAPDRVARDDRGRARRAARSRRTWRRAPAACRRPDRPRSRSRRAAGKAVVFATEDAARPRHARLGGARHPRRAASRRGDRGRPSVCTLVATGPTPEAVLADLEARAAACARAPRPGGASMPSPDALGAPAIDARPAAAAGWCATTSRPSSADGGGLERLHPHVPARRRVVRRARRAGAARSRASTVARPSSTRRSTRRRRSSRAARAPLVYGLGRTTCETQRAAVALAEAIGAVIDPAGPLLDGASGLAFQALRDEHGHAGRGPRPRRGRRGLAGRSGRDAPAALRAPAAAGAGPRARRRRRAADGDRGAGRHLPRAPGGPRRRGAVDAAGARPRGAVAGGARRRRSPTSPRGCAAARNGGDPAPRARARRGARRSTRSCATCAASTHVVAVTLRREAQRRRRGGRARLADRLPGGGQLRGRAPAREPGRAERRRGARPRRRRRGARRRLRSARAPAARRPPSACARSRSCRSTPATRRRPRAARVAFTTAAPGVHRAGVVHRLDGVPVPLARRARRPRARATTRCSRRSPSGSRAEEARGMTLRIAGGRVYDPANGVAGEVRDVCLQRRQGRRRRARARDADRRARHGRDAGRRRHPRPHRRAEGQRRAPAGARGAPGGRPSTARRSCARAPAARCRRRSSPATATRCSATRRSSRRRRRRWRRATSWPSCATRR